MRRPQPPQFLWVLFEQLRRRRLPLGLDDYLALRTALQAGFGWSSQEELGDLCVTLWAKSWQEAEIIRTLFELSEPPAWRLPGSGHEQPGDTATRQGEDPEGLDTGVQAEAPTPVTETMGVAALPALPWTQAGAGRSFVFVPQFPLTQREIAQAWRRLRRPIRIGPPTELAVDATVDRRSRSGVATPPVLVPARRNTARLLLLMDRQGSMAPFHRYIEYVAEAIQDGGRLEHVSSYYFHNVPVKSTDFSLLESLADGLSPSVDPILALIEPLADGHVYEDPQLLTPRPLRSVLDKADSTTRAVVFSDAGAARGHYDRLRLLSTIRFLKALRLRVATAAWLNPVAPEDWVGTTAAQLARHTPMFPLDRHGIHHAVDVLRGHPPSLERPL